MSLNDENEEEKINISSNLIVLNNILEDVIVDMCVSMQFSRLFLD